MIPLYVLLVSSIIPPPRQNILLMFMFMLRHEISDDLTDSTKFCKVQCSCSCKNLSHNLCSFCQTMYFSSNCYFHSHFDGSSQFDLS